MLIVDILKDIQILSDAKGYLDLDFADITANSKVADKNKLFFAYKGSSYDSHSDIQKLYSEGKLTLAITEKEIAGVPTIVVANGRKAFAQACANFFGRPHEKLINIAITGTNGKTTTSYIINSIFKSAGYKTVLIGTTGATVCDEYLPLDNTTPSPYDFNSMLADGIKKGAKVAISEVSSHALHQDRLAGTVFDIAVFLNITGDHLDYHGSLEEYYQAKKILFTDKYSKKYVINSDDEYGKRLIYEIDKDKTLTFGAEGDLKPEYVSMSLAGIQALLSYEGSEIRLGSRLTGKFNMQNILAATGAALAASISKQSIISGVRALMNVPGRMEKYSINGILVFVDYAHTDDALSNILSTLRELCEGRIISVFGAGGDRDKTKRPRMGKISQDIADDTILTNDNPRTENPNDIINDILTGITKRAGIFVEPDRRKAIEMAFSMAESGDVILIAGKGHEEYQIIGKEKQYFSDKEVIAEIINNIKQSKK